MKKSLRALKAIRLRAEYIVAHYGEDFFKGARILDVGSGLGDTARFFYELGAEVTCVDSVPANLDRIQQKTPDIKVIECNLDEGFPDGTWDLCLHLCVLHHLKHPVMALSYMCAAAPHAVLDAKVIDSDRSMGVFKREKPETHGHGMGKAYIVSAPFIQDTLENFGSTWDRRDVDELSTGTRKYTWKIKNRNKERHRCYRFWFVENRTHE